MNGEHEQELELRMRRERLIGQLQEVRRKSRPTLRDRAIFWGAIAATAIGFAWSALTGDLIGAAIGIGGLGFIGADIFNKSSENGDNRRRAHACTIAIAELDEELATLHAQRTTERSATPRRAITLTNDAPSEDVVDEEQDEEERHDEEVEQGQREGLTDSI